jgi:hypothetical protein
MKNLKDYVKESILGDWENIDVKKDIKSEIEQFLKDNYYGRFSITLVKGKYIVDSNSSLELANDDLTSLTNGLFKFGVIKKDFICSYCTKLLSLEGAPKKVGHTFACNGCKSLKTLEGAPEIVKDFRCDYCEGLETLDGSPKKVGGDFWCNGCKSLTSLKGAPMEVKGNFDCSNCKSLKILNGSPYEVGERYFCFNCGAKFVEDDVKIVCDVKGPIMTN